MRDSEIIAQELEKEGNTLNALEELREDLLVDGDDTTSVDSTIRTTVVLIENLEDELAESLLAVS